MTALEAFLIAAHRFAVNPNGHLYAEMNHAALQLSTGKTPGQQRYEADVDASIDARIRQRDAEHATRSAK